MIAVKYLAEFHNALQTLQISAEARFPAYSNYIGAADLLPMTIKGAERIKTWEHLPWARPLADASERFAHALHGLGCQWRQDLPRQLTHGDFWDNNVLFHDENVALIADFDFMGERERINDIALLFHFLLAKSETPEPLPLHLKQLKEILEQYDSALDDPLSPSERAALSLLIARQPLWSIGGWVVRLDSDETAQSHAADLPTQVDRALSIVENLDRWQELFACGE